MRTTSLLLALAACGAAFAASRAETTTYIDGNLPGVTPNSGGTLTFGDDNAMYLRTGFNSIAVPFAAINNAELGAVKETGHDTPFYKVWARHHSTKTETQYLIVAFKSEEGDDRTMTLELAQSAAAGVFADLQTRTGKTFASAAPKKTTPVAKTSPALKPANGWWGDDYWKTQRNADKWSKPAGTFDQQ